MKCAAFLQGKKKKRKRTKSETHHEGETIRASLIDTGLNTAPQSDTSVF